MPAQGQPSGPDWAVGEKSGVAVAEMKVAPCKARGMTEQAGHGVADAVGILQHLAQHHVAAALAVHRARRGKSGEAFAELVRRSELRCVELRVAAGQPTRPAMLTARLVA